MSQTLKIVIKRPLFLACLWLVSVVIADDYDRKDFNYLSYKPNTAIGFYTGNTCSKSIQYWIHYLSAIS